MYDELLPKFNVVEGPTTLMSRAKYSTHFSAESLRTYYTQPSIRFVNSGVKKRTVALVQYSSDTPAVIPEDVDATLFNFKVAVWKFAWGYLYTLIDPLLISVPFNTGCILSRNQIGCAFREYVQDLRIMYSHVSFKQILPQLPSLPIKKKHRRKRTHKAILQNKGLWVDNSSKPAQRPKLV